MILKNTTFEGFANDVLRNQKKIILFGTGTLFLAWIPYVLDTCQLKQNVAFCIDNRKEKWNTQIELGDTQYDIYPAEHLYHETMADKVILVTSSYFADIIEQLDRIAVLETVECYVAPVMHISHKKNSMTGQERIDSTAGKSKRRIPKIIHYCWFGKTPMPDNNRRCIESWKKYCPDYEIVEWNENNYDVHKNRYMSQAYESGKYGYVPDFARLDLLCEHGGLYFDTDVEIVRNLDDLLFQEAFCGFEEYPTINLGGGSGAVKGFPLFEKILDFRRNEVFLREDGSFNLTTCGYYETVPLMQEGLRLDGSKQTVRGLTVYPSEYFHPKSSVTGVVESTNATYSVHHFNWSWADDEQRKEKLRTHEKYQEIMKRMEKGEDNE